MLAQNITYKLSSLLDSDHDQSSPNALGSIKFGEYVLGSSNECFVLHLSLAKYQSNRLAILVQSIFRNARANGWQSQIHILETLEVNLQEVQGRLLEGLGAYDVPKTEIDGAAKDASEKSHANLF